jgi:hypothetical protein
MDILKQNLYDAPAVVYEAVLVAHAATTTEFPNCGLSGGDLLDPSK